MDGPDSPHARRVSCHRVHTTDFHSMNSGKLEDSLSLSPENQRRAFVDRHKADLVVFYDSRSVSFPRKGTQPTPLSRLWDLIYELEFSKRLERTPVMLTGGYAAWLEFIKKRVAKHANGNGVGRPYNPKAVNGYATSVPRPDRPSLSTSLSGDLGSKRAHRDIPVYQVTHYAKNIADSVSIGFISDTPCLTCLVWVWSTIDDGRDLIYRPPRLNAASQWPQPLP